MTEKNYPKLRFKGFTNAWEQRRLGEIADYRNGKPHENNIDKQGSYIVVNSKFVSSNGEVKKYSSMQIEPLYLNEIAFVLSDVPNGRAIARTFSVDKDGLYTLNQRIAGITVHPNTDSAFLNYILNRNYYFLRFDDGVGQTNLSKKDVERFVSKYPKLEEQTKIGHFFEILDLLIAANQRKLDRLRMLKKGYLQQIFEQKMRFNGYSEPWEHRKLGDVVSRVKSYPLTREAETVQETNYKYVHYGDIHTGVADLITDDNILPNIKSGSYDLLRKGDLIVADASEDYQGIAEPAIILKKPKHNMVSGLHTIALRPSSTNPLFIYYLLYTDIFKKYGHKTGTGMKVFGISYSNLADFETSYPPKNEQMKISNFFKTLDEHIVSQQNKIDKLQKLKKAYLQQMFI